MIDTHVHLGKFQLPGGGLIKEVTPRELIILMNKHGIEKAVALPIENPEETYDYYTTNQLLEDLSESKEYGERIIPFCNIDPRRGYNDGTFDPSPFIGEYIERGCKGFGEILANLHANDIRMRNIYHACGKYGIPVLLHLQTSTKGVYDLVGLPYLEEVLREFPETIFIGHAQGFWSEISADVTEKDKNSRPTGKVIAPGKVDELLEKHPNLYADVSALSGYNALARDREHARIFLKKHYKQLLFGTDYPCVGPDLIISLLRELCPSSDILEHILQKNAERILKL